MNEEANRLLESAKTLKEVLDNGKSSETWEELVERDPVYAEQWSKAYIAFAEAITLCEESNSVDAENAEAYAEMCKQSDLKAFQK